VPTEALTPFAVVVAFAPDHRLALEGPLDFDALTDQLDTALPDGAEGAAVRLEGHFASVRVRSVPKQTRPYPPLAEVIARQQVTDLRDVPGTVMGFRFPGPLGGVEIAGWHLHFATADRGRGGHVLACELERGDAELDHSGRLQVELPPSVDPPSEAEGQEEAIDRLERDRT
jgi:acetolactate decarboxylase